jgi:hypothetical protein
MDGGPGAIGKAGVPSIRRAPVAHHRDTGLIPIEARPHVGAELAGRLWSLTSVFDGYLAVVGSGGALIVDQSTVWWFNRRFGLMRSERYKYRQPSLRPPQSKRLRAVASCQYATRIGLSSASPTTTECESGGEPLIGFFEEPAGAGKLPPTSIAFAVCFLGTDCPPSGVMTTRAKGSRCPRPCCG